MKRARALTSVQKRIAEVRAERLALLERAAAVRHVRDNERGRVRPERSESEALVSFERPLLRGEVEPEVVVAEDGTVRLAPLEWSTVASDERD